MAEPDFQRMKDTAEKIAHPIYADDSWNQKESALKLWADAGLAIPSGGYPKTEIHSVKYADGSFVNEATIDGESRVTVAEFGKDFQCERQNDKNEKPGIQEIYECMGQHGATESEVRSMEDGAGFKSTNSSFEVVVGGQHLWQSDFKNLREYQPQSGLKLSQLDENGKETVIVEVKEGSGNVSRIEFFREDPLKLAEPPVLKLVQILNEKREVVSERTPNLKLWGNSK